MVRHSSVADEARSSIFRLVTIIGRIFQIRDDYQALSTQYSSQKGFCDDLDEGKYSYPILQVFSEGAMGQTKSQSLLRNIMAARTAHGGLSREMKETVREQLRDSSSLARTKSRLEELRSEVQLEICSMERQMGRNNWLVRLLVQKLRV